ncbi:site-2 protease family protein [Candidatus Proelusimicrobium excrementi]|uniref:site-2 protease family protein n=1 Tax=Candidatus Proelusimicrobium excrementi TaxID=3416222 RepID=UPI003CAD143D|nr:site-2 protease family protein [Elusimicrobiaceae bacterium]
MDFILFLPILIFSVIAHEFAHGYAAFRCGDDTAYLLGRLNFNPLKHIDLIGTVIVPLVLFMLNAPLFGWAKPVPVNYYRLRGGRKDIAYVSFAGPLTNILLMLAAVLIFKFTITFAPGSLIALKLLFYTIMINLVLAVVNLVPVPPLDGSKILAYFLPQQAAAKYLSLERYGFLILMVLVVTGIFGRIITPAFNFIFSLIINFIGVPYGAY